MRSLLSNCFLVAMAATMRMTSVATFSGKAPHMTFASKLSKSKDVSAVISAPFPARSAVASTTSTSTIQPGSKLPWVDLHWGFNPLTKIALPTHCAGRNVLILGVPGAFLEDSTQLVNSYKAHSNPLQRMGVDEVIVTAVNDAAVMGIWQQKIDTQGTILQFLADPLGELPLEFGTQASDHPSLGLFGRSKPFVVCVENCVIQHVVVAEDASDMAQLLAPAVMEVIQQKQQEQRTMASNPQRMAP